MELSNSERQARFRERKKALGDSKRLNMWISAASHRTLDALAKENGISRYQVIEALLGWFENDMFFQDKLKQLKRKAKYLRNL